MQDLGPRGKVCVSHAKPRLLVKWDGDFQQMESLVRRTVQESLKEWGTSHMQCQTAVTACSPTKGWPGGTGTGPTKPSIYEDLKQ